MTPEQRDVLRAVRRLPSGKVVDRLALMGAAQPTRVETAMRLYWLERACLAELFRRNEIHLLLGEIPYASVDITRNGGRHLVQR